MTLKELSQLYYLSREIDDDKRRLAELELKALPGAANMDGMPHGSGVSDNVARYAIEIADLKSIIEEKYGRCIEQRDKLEHYIASIDDSLTRQIFRRRFVDGLPWIQVAESVGGRNTAASVKMICSRYVKSHE